jgi:hypothetical protein
MPPVSPIAHPPNRLPIFPIRLPQVSQAAILNYIAEDDGRQATLESIPAGSHVLIPDDFTNSGSTLFGGATIVRSHIQGEATVAAWVSHFVAKYEHGVAAKFVAKLYSEGGQKSDLSAFYCSDSVACSVRWLNEEISAREKAGKPKLAHVFSCAPTIANWVLSAGGAPAAAPVQ